MRAALVCWLAGLSALSGCSVLQPTDAGVADDAGVGADAGGPGTSTFDGGFEGPATDAANALCVRLVACQLTTLSVGACTVQLAAAALRHAALPPERAGRLTGPPLVDCREEFSKVSCGTLAANGAVPQPYVSFLVSCLRYAVKPGAVGERCDALMECAPGLRCAGGCGVCTPPGGPGAPCRFDTDCELASRCTSRVCTPRLAAGASCSSSADCADHLCLASRCVAPVVGQPCTGNGACGAVLVCDRALGTCQPRATRTDGILTVANVSVGADCDSDVRGPGARTCASGTWCRGLVPSVDGGPGVAGRCAPLEAGAPCSSTSPWCGTGTVCDDRGDGGVCVPNVPGGPCFYLSRDCANGEACSNALGQGQCQPRVGDGGACPGPDSCADGLVCAQLPADGGFSDNRCVRPPAEGQPCVPRTHQPASCPYPLACDQGVCVQAGEVGQRCTDLRSCRAGACRAVDGGPLAADDPDAWCFPPLAAGQRCANHADCTSGTRCLSPPDGGATRCAATCE